MLSKDPFIPPPPPRCKETSIYQMDDAWLTCSPEPLRQLEKERGGDTQAQYFIPETVSEPAHSLSDYYLSGRRSVFSGAALCNPASLIPHPPAFRSPEAESCCRAAGTKTRELACHSGFLGPGAQSGVCCPLPAGPMRAARLLGLSGIPQMN